LLKFEALTFSVLGCKSDTNQKPEEPGHSLVLLLSLNLPVLGTHADIAVKFVGALRALLEESGSITGRFVAINVIIIEYLLMFCFISQD
jgi:hypothetical protein